MRSPLPLAWSRWPTHSFNAADSKVVVLLHGLFGSRATWRTLGSSLAGTLASTHRAVIAVDLRNHGESPWSHEMDYDTLATDVAAFIENQVGTQVDLIGHSLGGRVAMHLALKTRPSCIRKLVVVDVAPLPEPSYPVAHYRSFVEAMMDVQSQQLISRSDADRQLARTIKDAAFRQLFLSNLVRSSRPSIIDSRTDSHERGSPQHLSSSSTTPLPLRFRYNLEAIHQYLPELAVFPLAKHSSPQSLSLRSQIPTLFVAGSKSSYLTSSHAQNAAFQFFPNASIESVDAGHWVHHENPRDLEKVVVPFLQQ